MQIHVLFTDVGKSSSAIYNWNLNLQNETLKNTGGFLKNKQFSFLSVIHLCAKTISAVIRNWKVVRVFKGDIWRFQIIICLVFDPNWKEEIWSSTKSY